MGLQCGLVIGLAKYTLLEEKVPRILDEPFRVNLEYSSHSKPIRALLFGSKSFFSPHFSNSNKYLNISKCYCATLKN